MENKVLRFMEDIVYFRVHGDEKGLAALMNEEPTESVTMRDVASALIQVVDELTAYVDAAQALDEVRLKAVIDCLPKEIQDNIARKFEEAEDDLLTQELEGENN